MQEILVKHMANQALNVPASYNDLFELRGYRSGQTGTVRVELARFGPLWMAGAYENGRDQPLYKMEGIRDFQQENSSGVKRPMPIGWIVQFDFADLGDDKEQYRHVHRLNENRSRDAYGPMMAMCKAFSAPDDTLKQAVEEVIDVDQWARMMAIQTLCGIADVYPVENPHNFNTYVRPTDGRIIAIPWDWDFTFNLGATSRILDPKSSRKNLWRIMDTPGIRRLYEGHLVDLIDRTFNESYARTWFEHYGEVAGSNYGSHINYVRSRASAVKGQLSAPVLFSIDTNAGQPLTVEASSVTLRGKGQIRLRTLRWEETGEVLTPYWVDDETWEVTLPLQVGENTITLQGLNAQGGKGSLFSPMGSGQIVVTNSSHTAAPTADSLRISEIMYRPGPATEGERAEGVTDRDDFEFIELHNAGSDELSLSGVEFVEGIRATMDEGQTLAPGEAAVLVRNREAFGLRYGERPRILGVYEGSLSNGGETLVLALGDLELHRFAYNDRAPWPEEADGDGFSLTSALSEAPNGEAAAWRASRVSGGTPGMVEEDPPAGDLVYEEWLVTHFDEVERGDEAISGRFADPDGDGLVNLVEYFFATAPKQAGTLPLIEVASDSETIRVSYPRRRGLGDVGAEVEVSSDLEEWQSPAAGEVAVGPTDAIEGREDVVKASWTGDISGQERYLRVRVG
ncbi:MAG: CotH kinase family protein, partial [Verrucomicrobiota bacterium]